MDKNINRKYTRKRQAWGLPWFRKYDGWWYVTVRGAKIKLVKGDPAQKDNNREEAVKEWHRVMALHDAAEKQDNNPLWVVFEHFLDHVSRTQPGSYKHYARYLQSFKDKYPAVRVGELKVGHVDDWLASHPPWSESTKRFAASIVLAALNFAAKPERGLITRNPIKGMTLPAARSRGAETIIDEATFQRLFLEARTMPWLQDALLFLRETGTRPGNLARIEARSIDVANRCVRIEQHKTRRKTGKPLLIPLTERALNQLLRLAERYPEGPLFRGARGTALTGRKITASFVYLKKKLGLGKEVILYGLRHTFATELISKNMPESKVAFVLGHSDTKMLHKHYAHLDSNCKDIAVELEKCLENEDNAS